MANSYFFYCIICGKSFSAKKNHARCCSAECRVVLSNTVRQNAVIDDEQEPVEKEDVAEKYKKTTGNEMPRGVLDRLTEKPKEAEDTGRIGFIKTK